MCLSALPLPMEEELKSLRDFILILMTKEPPSNTFNPAYAYASKPEMPMLLRHLHALAGCHFQQSVQPTHWLRVPFLRGRLASRTATDDSTHWRCNAVPLFNPRNAKVDTLKASAATAALHAGNHLSQAAQKGCL